MAIKRARPGQKWAGPKPGWAQIGPVFRAKILTAQPALKTGPVGPNSLFKAKKIRAGQAGPGHTGPGHIGLSQIWPDFFRANNLMAQPGPNFGRTGLAHRVGPILPPLATSSLGYELYGLTSCCLDDFCIPYHRVMSIHTIPTGE